MQMRRLAPLALAMLFTSGHQTRSAALVRRPSGEFSIKYFGHCCFLIESPAGTKVLIDPYAANPEQTPTFRGSGFPAYQLPAAGLDADVVLLSHGHDDHDYGGIHLIQERWGDRVPVLQDGDLFIGDVHAIGMAGKHSSRGGNPEFKNVIWSIDIGGSRIVHWGDNSVPSDEQMRLLVDDKINGMEGVRVLMLPIDAGCHLLSYEDVDRIRSAIKPTVLVPMHYLIPKLHPTAARLDLMSTDWKELQWGPLEPWLKEQAGVVQLDSNELVLGDDFAAHAGEVLVFRWPLAQ